MTDTIIIQRLDEVDSDGTAATEGNGTAPDGYTFLTLEPTALLTPPGRYPMRVLPMASHGPALRVELIVPGHTGRFLHSINRASESLGCTGIGDFRPASGLLSGGIYHHVADKLAELVADVIKADGEAWCSILPIPEAA